jgi:hypothetical protein
VGADEGLAVTLAVRPERTHRPWSRAVPREATPSTLYEPPPFPIPLEWKTERRV